VFTAVAGVQSARANGLRCGGGRSGGGGAVGQAGAAGRGLARMCSASRSGRGRRR